jgi:hypothetical protein
MDDPIHVKALFLGPKAENYRFFRKCWSFSWTITRTGAVTSIPTTPPVVTGEEQDRPDFLATLQKTREALIELAGNLQVSSMRGSPRATWVT